MHKPIVAVAIALLMTACATPKAPEFGGRWKPVNHFSETTKAIPLYPAYVYQASPMDGTLKNLLARWARDSSLELSYQVAADYTLHAPLASVETTDLQAALDQLSGIYAEQGLAFSSSQNRIVVQTSAATSLK